MALDSNRWQVHWGGHALAEWDAAHGAALGALQQDWSYGSAMLTLGVPVLRARVDQDGETVAQAQFIVRRFGRLASIALCSRGPVWRKSLSDPEQAEVYRALKRSLPLSGLRVMLITPEQAVGEIHSLSAMRRVVTGMSTVLLDLRPSMDQLRANLEHRWRHQLASSEASGLRVERVGVQPNQFRWLLEADIAQRQDRGLDGLPPAFVERYPLTRTSAASTILTLRADAGRERVAAMMFLIHGASATYHIGWTTDAGRDAHAHNLILWKAIEELKARGIQQLDLGGVNTIRSAGVARFKLRTGGKLVTLAGSYLL
jgi:lipid II:glycine glycyltransferase (peptidoglycan interpeptide bridge formation enzyme)